MRKLMLGAGLAVLLAVPAQVNAQTANGTVNASARINAVLTATVVSALNFGTAISSSAGTVSVATGAAPSGTGQALGAIEIDHNSDFTVSVTSASANLVNGAETMAVTFDCAYSATGATGAIVGSETACSSLGSRTATTAGTTQTTWLQVGGDLTVPAGALPGTYSGSIVFQLTASVL